MLTVELVRAARNMMGNVSCNALGTGGAVLPVSVADLCDTCEALRAEVDALKVERDKWSAQVLCAEVKARVNDDGFKEAVALVHRAADAGNAMAAERDAALARAEQAERERDEARVRYCRLAACANGGLPSDGSAREECLAEWPDAAAALFPGKEVDRG